MSERPSDELDAIEARLAAARGSQAPIKVAGSALASGSRYAVEIVAGVVVGGFIGWQLDRWLGTKPWLALVFLLLGLAAGFMNLMRGVNAEQRQVNAQPVPPSVREEED